MQRKILFTVTTDLTYDQRMKRICKSLSEAHFDVKIVGRKLPNSQPLDSPGYAQKRLNCWFKKGKLFYLEINIRFFLLALFANYDILCAVDMDTLPGVFGPAQWRKKTLVYDAHEYFSEVIEVAKRPKIQSIWKRLEKKYIPRVKHAYTVNSSLANIFEQEYGTPFRVIRNISHTHDLPAEANWKGDIIYIGAVNDGRGLRELLQAMPQIDRNLRICGMGDLFDDMKSLAKELGIENKVIFEGFVEPNQLAQYTREASLGYLMLENVGLSYYYSLANKFYDYIHAGIPQVCIDFPEYRAISEKYECAALIPLEEDAIVKTISDLLSKKDLYDQKVHGALEARKELNWESESEGLIKFYQELP